MSQYFVEKETSLTKITTMKRPTVKDYIDRDSREGLISFRETEYVEAINEYITSLESKNVKLRKALESIPRQNSISVVLNIVDKALRQ